MAVRSTMASLILRLRSLINDPAGSAQVFSDQEIQDVLDASRIDISNMALTPYATYSGSSLQFLDYYSDNYGDWEDGAILKQYRTITVTAASSEPIVGHWVFAASTLPPIYITGATYDVYRAAADLLERWSAKWALSYSVQVDGQSLQRSQVLPALLSLAKAYRLKQRMTTITTTRSDLMGSGARGKNPLGPQEIDYY